ncbi:MAG TPA: ABC transporter ATP-binding protein [Gemmataceae bacterium]|nr:ABC transporter ATP-binding protein [Gemmataceae bacterium]
MSKLHPTLVARDVHKSFGSGSQRAPVLRGVSMEASRGETVFLVGPSGSGKTTLLSILGCILTPDHGSVQVLGQEVAGMTAKQLTAFRRDNLGFIFQTFNLFPTLSAQDNVALSLAMRGVPGRTAGRQAEELLNLVGLGPRRKARPAQMSGGECQRVAVARALAADPALVFADEPTASLDAENGQAVMQLLTRLVRERGVTLIVVTHDNRIFSYADRVLRLEDGCMAHEWVPTETRNASEPPTALVPQRRRFLKEHVA